MKQFKMTLTSKYELAFTDEDGKHIGCLFTDSSELVTRVQAGVEYIFDLLKSKGSVDGETSLSSQILEAL